MLQLECGRTTRLDEWDLAVVDHVKCEENGADIANHVAQERSLHEMKWAK